MAYISIVLYNFHLQLYNLQIVNLFGVIMKFYLLYVEQFGES